MRTIAQFACFALSVSLFVSIAVPSISQAATTAGPLPVVAASDQHGLLASADPKLAANKRLVYDFWRTILIGHHLDETSKFLDAGYIQHNPSVNTGRNGFLEFIAKRGGVRAIPSEIPGLVAIQAEGDFVTFSFVADREESSGGKYTTTWFDMFRISNAKIAEHWDCALKK